MTVTLSKTDYLLYRECPKNVWYKVHAPEIFEQSELSEFEQSLMEAGNEVELIARRLFPDGLLLEHRDERGLEGTKRQIAQKSKVLFQPVFRVDGFIAAVDILKLNADSGSYSIYEVKSTSSVDTKTHYYDLAFQLNVLRKCGLLVNRLYLVHLNSDYVRAGEIDISLLFQIVDVTSETEDIAEAVASEMADALAYLTPPEEPKGHCSCIYKGRSRHCSTFRYANPEVPEYSVHDIARIGNSKAKLREIVDGNIFHLDKVPPHIKLSNIQQNQIDTYVQNRIIILRDRIAEELGKLTFPLYFLDYETYPGAIPRFDGFSPYNQIPFQYSVHIVTSQKAEPQHCEFLHVEATDPSIPFAESLQSHVGITGNIVVWSKSFECGRNNEIATRNPELMTFMDSINSRIYDLEEIFRMQYHVHRDYRGSTSIKSILPVLVPELSYEKLPIRDGASAADTWNKIVNGYLASDAREKAICELRTYCGLDTFAMYSIWRALSGFI